MYLDLSIEVEVEPIFSEDVVLLPSFMVEDESLFIVDLLSTFMEEDELLLSVDLLSYAELEELP